MAARRVVWRGSGHDDQAVPTCDDGERRHVMPGLGEQDSHRGAAWRVGNVPLPAQGGEVSGVTTGQAGSPGASHGGRGTRVRRRWQPRPTPAYARLSLCKFGSCKPGSILHILCLQPGLSRERLPHDQLSSLLGRRLIGGWGVAMVLTAPETRIRRHSV